MNGILSNHGFLLAKKAAECARHSTLKTTRGPAWSTGLWIALCCVFWMALSVGCQNSGDSAGPESLASEDGKKSPAMGNVRLLVIDQPELAEALKLVQGDWKALANGDLQVSQANSADLESGAIPECDVFLAPSWFVSVLGERGLASQLPVEIAAGNQPRLENLTQSSQLSKGDSGNGQSARLGANVDAQSFAWNDLYPLLRKQCAVWNDKTVAAPLGEPVPVLVYRADLFADAKLPPPETWEDYAKAQEALANGADASPPRSPTLEPLASGSAGLTLLARAASYAKHADYFTTFFEESGMKSRLGAPPFVRALEELKAARMDFSKARKLDFSGTVQAVLQGEASMGIGWFTPTTSGQDSALTVPADVGFAPLPGSREVYLTSIKRWDKREREASWRVTFLPAVGPAAVISTQAVDAAVGARFVSWLGGPESKWAFSTPLGGTSRYSQEDSGNLPLAAPAGVQRTLLQVIEQSMESEQALFAPRMPGRSKYLQALDMAVFAALDGSKTPQQALDDAAAEWDQITQTIGIEKQKLAYEHGVRFRRQ